MKKVLLWILMLSMVVCCLSACASEEPVTTETPALSTEKTEPTALSTEEVTPSYKVAMITDSSDITDGAYNQVTFEAGRDWCWEYNIPYTYYKPTEYSTAERIASMEQAIEEGANVLLLPGYAFGDAIAEIAEAYPQIYFIALDVGPGDFGDYTLPANVFSTVYQEEVAGFLAGYAAVKLGYRNLGFDGVMPVPGVIRYGYGFIQGADYAAEQLGAQISLKYAYGPMCDCSGEEHEYADIWFQEGTEVIFYCGNRLYLEPQDIDKSYDRKIIAADVDQSKLIDAHYGEGTALTTATKNLSATVSWALSELILEGNWENMGGTLSTLGLVSSTEPEKNHVILPDNTQWSNDFTKADYAAVVEDILSGAVTVDSSIEQIPGAPNVTVTDLGYLN